MSDYAFKDCDAAVTLPTLYVSERASARLHSSILERLPLGFDEGASKLILSYKGAELAIRHQAGKPIDDTVDEVARLSQKLESFDVRRESLRQSFAGALKCGYAKATSFIAENVLIFSGAAVGAAVGGPVGGVTGSTVATYPQVFGSSFLAELKDKECDLTDAAQIREVLADAVFARQARNLAHVSAAKMSTAVLASGVLAGYVYSSVTRPAAQAGASMARSLFSGLSGVAKENGAKALGDIFAQAAKSATNGVAKKAIEAIPTRALLVSGVAYDVGHELVEHMEEGHDLAAVPYYGATDYDAGDGDIPDAALAAAHQNLPSYNLSHFYI